MNLVSIGDNQYYKKNFDEIITADGFAIPQVTDNSAWSTSKTLYDNAIVGGASVREALEASAMWCYYENDPSYNSDYGKLYNWFAAKLFQDAFDDVNANKAIPTQADFVDIQTTLGGAAVAGEHLKEKGTERWASPNYADNSAGLTLVGAGIRLESGSFQSIKGFNRIWTTTEATSINGYMGYLVNNDTYFNIAGNDKGRGFTIRLKKK